MATTAATRIFALEAGRREISATSLTGLLLVAGLIHSLVAAYVLGFLLPELASYNRVIFAKAMLYIVVTALAGVAGIRLYWNRSNAANRSDLPFSFPLLAVISLEGWLWVPAFWLLYRQDALYAVLFAALGAGLLAFGLRKAPWQQLSTLDEAPRMIFQETLRSQPRELDGYWIALALYAAAYLLLERSTLAASTLIAPSAFVVVWRLTLLPAPERLPRRAAPRLASIALAAIVATFLILRIGVGHLLPNPASAQAVIAAASPAAVAALNISGYESIILWPVLEKKQIYAPLLDSGELLAPGTKQPLILRFNGPYWYFQPPHTQPSPTAHQAHGTPLELDIQARNAHPLTMQARQSLSAPIRLAHCREIRLTVRSRERTSAPFQIALWLTDESAPGKPTLELGQQTLTSSLPDAQFDHAAAATEVLHFAVPAHARLRRFNQMTVVFLSDTAYAERAPKIALQQFELLPR